MADQIGSERRVMVCTTLSGSGITIEPDTSVADTVIYIKCPNVPLMDNFMDKLDPSFQGAMYDEYAGKMPQMVMVKGILTATNVNTARKLLKEAYINKTTLYCIVKKPTGAGAFENVNFLNDAGTEVFYLQGRPDKMLKIVLVEGETYEISFKFTGWVVS